jgi:hypothetical protein
MDAGDRQHGRAAARSRVRATTPLPVLSASGSVLSAGETGSVLSAGETGSEP